MTTDEVMARYAAIHESMKQHRTQARALREEKAKCEVFLEEEMRRNNQTEIAIAATGLVVRARERVVRKRATKEELAEGLAEQMGVNATELKTTIEAMASESTRVSFSLASPKRKRSSWMSAGTEAAM